MKFNQTGINENLQKAAADLQFENTTEIQEKVIPLLIESSEDIIALAQTGTGKTAAFGFPILHNIDTELKKIQAIILSPTRELALQISSDLKSYSKHLPNIAVSTVYGGVSPEKQFRELKGGAQIVVGTPGRVLDLIKRNKIDLSKVRYFVLDEADEMLNMGFKEELDSILSFSSDEKQMLLFSATMPKEVEKIARKYMNSPIQVSAGEKNTATKDVEHFYYKVHARDRYKALKRIADVNPKIYAIIFCRTRAETKDVADNLIADGYNADALHGDLSQAQRDSVMGKFRNKHLQLLVATDVAARGLDVDNVSHIINYNLPDENEAYIHRSGRTGRAGKKGISLSIVHLKENHKIKQIEQKAGVKFKQLQVPTGEEICTKQLFNYIDKVENVELDNEQIESFLPPIYKKLEWLSREELIKHFVSVEFNQFLDYYKDAEDINVSEKEQQESEKSDKKRKKTRRSKFTKVFLNMGQKDKLNAKALISFINKNPEMRDASIGKIEILKSFSFVEIDSDYAEYFIEEYNNTTFKGNKLVIEEKKSEGPPRSKSLSRSRKKKR